MVLSHETVRRWVMKFGREYARRLRRKRSGPRDIWHLDEVVIRIGCRKHWQWRAVDQDGYILDEIVQTRRDTKAARHLLRRLLKKQGCPPRRMITDKLGSYGAARRQIPASEHANGRASLAQRPHQQSREFAPALAAPRAGDAGLSISRRPTAVRQRLLRRPQSLRPAQVSPLRPLRPSPSTERHGAMESRGRCRRLSPVTRPISPRCANRELT